MTKQSLIPTLFFIISFFSAFSQDTVQTVGVFLNKEAAYDGYTLLVPVRNKTTYLIDNCGEIINKWESDFMPGLSAYLLEDGSLVRSVFKPGILFGSGLGGGVEKYDWEGNLIWSFDYIDETFHQHHDIQPLPNGNVLLLSWDARTSEEALASGKEFVGSGLLSEKIVEIEPTSDTSGIVVWEWKAWDHLIQDIDSSKLNYGNIASHPELIDINYDNIAERSWIHANGVDYNPELDQIIISSRNYSEFWIIDHSTTSEEAATHTGGLYGKGGDILYRWGNPRAYKRGIEGDQILYNQHDAQWIPSGYVNEGKIIAYNNLVGFNTDTISYSSVEVMAPNVDDEGNYLLPENDPYLPLLSSNTFKGHPDDLDFFSQIMSGVQAQPNGNILICAAVTGKLLEIDTSGTIVWKYTNPVIQNGPVAQGATPAGNTVFKARRYAADYPAFEGRDLTPDGFIEILDDWEEVYNCIIFPEIDTMIVDTTTANTNTLYSSNWEIFPNPTLDNFHLSFSGNMIPNSICTIYNYTGKLIYSKIINAERTIINSTNWPSGIYFIQINNQPTIHKIIKL